jgi:LysM repeat protein
LSWPVLLVVALVALWLWKPWQARGPQAAASPSATASDTAVPTATYAIGPTATPLQSPTPTPTPTPPPNQTTHTVQKGETVISIAKDYGTTAQAIRTANNLKGSATIRVGDELIIPLPVADTPVPTPTPLPSPTPWVYVVQPGDTLSEIARKFGTTVERLMQVNDLESGSDIRAGDRLTIAASEAPPTPPTIQTYEVQTGDTLYGIAAKFKTTVAAIKQLNGLKSDSLKAGQKLKIPAGAVSLAPTATATPTPEPTQTLTPVPTPPRPAPALLGPVDGTAFVGAEPVPLLNWASVGILGEDEWYVLRVRRTGPLTQQLPAVWTQSTSWRLPPELYIAGLAEPQRFHWAVSVMRKAGEAADGTWQGTEESPRSETRTFTWQ